jgi:hypothetical protein
LNWAWRYIPAIPVLRRLRQEDLKFKDRLSYIGRLCLKKKKKRCCKGGTLCELDDLEHMYSSGATVMNSEIQRPSQRCLHPVRV